MKQKLKNSPFLQAWFYTQSPLVITRPALRETLSCLGCVLEGFLLSCGVLGGSPSPFALGLLAAMGGGLRGLGCLVGATAGFLSMHPLPQGLQMVSAGILIYVCNYIFGSLWITKRPWFSCVVAGSMTALVGLIFLLSQKLSLLSVLNYGQTVLLAGVTPPCYISLLRLRRRSSGSLLALGTFLLGAARLFMPWGICLGAVAAVSLMCTAARRADGWVTVALAAGTGLALDIGLETGYWTLSLCCGALLGSAVPDRFRMMRVTACAMALLASLGYTGNLEAAQWMTVSFGVLLSFLLPAGLIAGRKREEVARTAELVEDHLSGGQAVLRRLYLAVGAESAVREDQDTNRIFDRAAAKVCRRCPRCRECWEREAQETYRSLRPVLTGGLERGMVRQEDFGTFRDRCVRLEELVEALNRELDVLAGRHQDRSRREEERTVISRYLLHLSQLLGENARQLRGNLKLPDPSYSVKLGVAARGRGGNRLSGDRGASFRTDDGRFFVILCDGAGSGEPAARESLLAVDTLVELIGAGMPAENAMELLNGMYLLRDQGGFATMDVLEVSLLSGQGTLYKWGAAPSFVRSGNGVRRVGAAAPPPGLEAGGRFGAEVTRLNLWDGDAVVLVSDGIDSSLAEELIRGYGGEDMKALTRALIDGAAGEMEDDVTAAAVRLTELRGR